MADSFAPQNVIFNLVSKVTGKNEAGELAASIEQVDEKTKAAQSTVDQFDKGLARQIAQFKQQKAAQDQVAAGSKAISAAVVETTAKVNGLTSTVAKSVGTFGTFAGLDEQTANLLQPLLSDTARLGEEARDTGGDMAFLAAQAKAAGKAAVGLPGTVPTSASGVPAPVATGPDVGAQTQEVQTFAAALTLMAEKGTIGFEQLKAAARSQLDTLKEANAEALKTPQGKAALKDDLEASQTEALDLLQNLKAINAEERAILEVSTKIANAAKNPAPLVPPEQLGILEQATLRVKELQAQKAKVIDEESLKRVNTELQEANTELERLKQLGLEASNTPPVNPGILQQAVDKVKELEAAKLTITDEGSLAKLNKDLTAAKSELERLQKLGKVPLDPEVKKSVVTWTSLRTRMQQAKAELDALIEKSDGQITPEIIAAAKNAGELQDRFEDLQQTVNAFNPDKKFQVFAGVIQNVAGGFTALQGALALVGVESDGVQQSLLKVQAALAITQGLQALFGGLRDNLKNIRLLLVANTIQTRGLAVAEGQAAVGATAQATATSGLSAALTTAKGAATQLWATLVANPIGIVVAAIGTLLLVIAALAEEEEVARRSADSLLESLERLGKVQGRGIDRRKSEESLQSERTLIEDIAAIERERLKVSESATEQEKLKADAIRDQAIAAAEARKRERDVSIDTRAIDAEIDIIRVRRQGIEDQLVLMNGLHEERSDFTEEELEEIIKLAKAQRDLTDEQLALEQRRNELRGKLRNDNLKAEEDAARKLIENQRKLNATIVKEGTIAALQAEASKLSDALTKQLRIGSPEFFDTVAKYIDVTERLKEAQALLQGQESFPAGSIADLNQELTNLQATLKLLPGEGEEFLKVAAAVNELQAAIDKLNEAIKPKDDKAITSKKLAELEEEKRHFLAIDELDREAAINRAKSAGKSEAEIKAIEAQFDKDRLAAEIDFQLRKLEILRAGNSATKEEVTKAENELRELQLKAQIPPDTSGTKRALKELVKDVVDAADKIAQAGIGAWKAWSDAQLQSIDLQVQQQQRRVEDARATAEQGNAVLLREEKKRLQELLAERERAAQRNALIAQIEAAAQAVVAVARAAAEGGTAAGITIAATLIALAAGIASAQQLTSTSVPTSSFRKGGAAEWSKLGGYTGSGHPDGVSTAVGAKPYAYHNDEYIQPHEVVKIGRNRMWFEKIHRGRINMDHLIGKGVPITVAAGGTSDKQIDRVVDAVNRIPQTGIVFDAEGVTGMVRGNVKQDELFATRL